MTGAELLQFQQHYYMCLHQKLPTIDTTLPPLRGLITELDSELDSEATNADTCKAIDRDSIAAVNVQM